MADIVFKHLIVCVDDVFQNFQKQRLLKISRCYLLYKLYLRSFVKTDI